MTLFPVPCVSSEAFEVFSIGLNPLRSDCTATLVFSRANYKKGEIIHELSMWKVGILLFYSPDVEISISQLL